MPKTKKRGGKINQKGCGKCKKLGRKKCTHRTQRGGCGTCAGGHVGGGKKQIGGNITSGVSEMFLNVFRGFQGQPPLDFPSF